MQSDWLGFYKYRIHKHFIYLRVFIVVAPITKNSLVGTIPLLCIQLFLCDMSPYRDQFCKFATFCNSRSSYNYGEIRKSLKNVRPSCLAHLPCWKSWNKHIQVKLVWEYKYLDLSSFVADCAYDLTVYASSYRKPRLWWT